MEKKGYHHGDLRRALIETGIEIISLEGEEKLSLRNVAERCGVSNAAPYAHFKNKDEFIVAMQQHVMELFTAALEESVQRYVDSPDILLMLGKAYVLFFLQNPLYYDFLFSQKNIRIQLSMEECGEVENQPLNILKRTAVDFYGKWNMPTEMIQDRVIAMWALVHGLAKIAIMPNVEYEGNWDDRIEKIIRSFSN